MHALETVLHDESSLEAAPLGEGDVHIEDAHSNLMEADGAFRRQIEVLGIGCANVGPE